MAPRRTWRESQETSPQVFRRCAPHVALGYFGDECTEGRSYPLQSLEKVPATTIRVHYSQARLLRK